MIMCCESKIGSKEEMIRNDLPSQPKMTRPGEPADATLHQFLWCAYYNIVARKTWHYGTIY